MQLLPYLFFTNTAKEAMTRYQEILGGELEISTFGELPPSDDLSGNVPADLVMHALLTLEDGVKIMGSDDPTGDGAGVKGAALNLTLTDEAEGKRIFEALAEGGQVNHPLEATFWAPLFGTCVDRFGVQWMLNVEPEGQN